MPQASRSNLVNINAIVTTIHDYIKTTTMGHHNEYYAPILEFLGKNKTKQENYSGIHLRFVFDRVNPQGVGQPFLS